MQPALSVTPAALAHVKKMIAKQGSGIGFRLAIKDSGCSGKKYIVSIIEEKHTDDKIFDLDSNLVLCVDPASYVFVVGTTIDYVSKGLEGSSFVFDNPNEKGSCGCGESFNV